MSFLTEQAAIKNADRGVRARILLERRIAVQLVEELLEQGFILAVDDGESEPQSSTKRGVILSAMATTDEDYLLVHWEDLSQRGWVRLTYGNDGWDVIADNTTNLEPFITKTNALVEMLGGR
jgi:hypothetical protein